MQQAPTKIEAAVKEEAGSVSIVGKAPAKKANTEVPRLRVIFHENYFRTRIQPFDASSSELLKKEIGVAIEEVYSDPFRVTNPKIVDTGVEGGITYFEFFTTELYREIVLLLSKSFDLQYVNESFSTFLNPPETIVSRWNSHLPFAQPKTHPTNFLNPQLTPHQNFLLKRAVDTAFGRVIFKGSLLTDKKVLSLLSIQAFRRGPNQRTPVVVIAKHGRLGKWEEVIKMFIPDANIVVQSYKKEKFESAKDVDFIICSDKCLDRLAKVEEGKSTFRYFILDDVLENRGQIRKLSGFIKNPERIAMIIEDYDDLEIGIKKLLFGVFLRPDLAGKDGSCKSYPCVQASHVFDVEPSILFDVSKGYEIEEILSITPASDSRESEITKIESLISSKNKSDIQTVYTEKFPEKAKTIKEQLEKKYQTTKVGEVKAGEGESQEKTEVVEAKNQKKSIAIKDLQGYLENHTQESMKQALRFYLQTLAEESKMEVMVQELEKGSLQSCKRLVVCYHSQKNLDFLKQKIETAHPKWRMIVSSGDEKDVVFDSLRSRFENDDPEKTYEKHLLLVPVTSNARRMIGFKLDALVFTDVAYYIDKVKQGRVLVELSPFQQDRKVLYLFSNTQTDLSTISKFSSTLNIPVPEKPVVGNITQKRNHYITTCGVGGLSLESATKKVVCQSIDMRTEKQIKEHLEKSKPSKIVEESPIKQLGTPDTMAGRVFSINSPNLVGVASPSQQMRTRAKISSEVFIKKDSVAYKDFKAEMVDKCRNQVKIVQEKVSDRDEVGSFMKNMFASGSSGLAQSKKQKAVFGGPGKKPNSQVVPPEMAELGKRMLSDPALKQEMSTGGMASSSVPLPVKILKKEEDSGSVAK